MTAPKCGIHVGTEMVAVETKAPRFVVTCDEQDSNGRPKRRRRIIYQCPVPDCHRVAMAEEDGIDWRETRICRICRANPSRPDYAVRHDYRCNSCIAARVHTGRRTRGATIRISRTAEVYA